MSHQQRVIPDPFDFARRADTLAGELDARHLVRVADQLRAPDTAQPVQYEVRGERVDGKSFLHVSVSARLVMQCQRCLGEVVCEPQQQSSLLLVPRDQPLPDEDLENDEFDPVHAGRDFDVLDAVEEELLLALPLAPAHEECALPGGEDGSADSSPFAMLKSLKLKR